MKKTLVITFNECTEIRETAFDTDQFFFPDSASHAHLGQLLITNNQFQ